MAISPKEFEFNYNEDKMRLKIRALEQAFEKVSVGGGKKKIDKLHKAGKLTALDRPQAWCPSIDALDHAFGAPHIVVCRRSIECSIDPMSLAHVATIGCVCVHVHMRASS